MAIPGVEESLAFFFCRRSDCEGEDLTGCVGWGRWRTGEPEAIEEPGPCGFRSNGGRIIFPVDLEAEEHKVK